MGTFSFYEFFYDELNAGSGVLHLARDQSNSEIKQQIKCAWPEARLIAMAFRGVTYDTSTGLFVVQQPLTDPFGAGYFCTDAVVEPLGKPSGFNTWDWATIKLTFSPLVYFNGTLIEENLDLCSEIVDLTQQNWSYGSTYTGDEPVQQPIQKLIPLITYEITQSNVATLPLSAIAACMGKLNDDYWKGAPPDTVLYMGAKAKRQVVSIAGSQVILLWTLVHRFMVSTRDLRTEWNPNGSPPAFQQVQAASGVYKFEEADFDTLGVPTV
jgi:hypothetical protein